MKAMMLDRIAHMERNDRPLRPADLDTPSPDEGELLIRNSVCGVCHTELDEIEGRTPPTVWPVVPGHQVVGRVEGFGNKASHEGFRTGDRVGVAWIHSACGECEYCKSGRENLCKRFVATGRDVNGGYAEYMTVPAGYAVRIPDELSDEEAAPLLCAGAIGFRSLRLTGLQNGQHLGLTGFGASGHLVLQLARYLYPDSRIFVFARNEEARRFALELGAEWAGATEDRAPQLLHAMIDTTPAWKPVVEAMANLKPGGRLVVNAIRKEDNDRRYLLNLDYTEHLWMEKEIKSVANVTREDVQEILRMAASSGIRPEVQIYPMEEANRALEELKSGGGRGAKVLKIG